MAIYSGFSHQKWWFSIATLNYQRVTRSGIRMHFAELGHVWSSHKWSTLFCSQCQWSQWESELGVSFFGAGNWKLYETLMIPTTCCWFHDILNFEMNIPPSPTSCCGDTSFGLCLPNYYVLADFHDVFLKISSWTIMDDSHKVTSIDPFFHTQLVYHSNHKP
jgi:hypothetical protein